MRRGIKDNEQKRKTLANIWLGLSFTEKINRSVRVVVKGLKASGNERFISI